MCLPPSPEDIYHGLRIGHATRDSVETSIEWPGTDGFGPDTPAER
jgi:hypothetical protein